MKFKRPLTLAAAIGSVGLSIIFSPTGADAQLRREKSNLSREVGAIYLEDFTDERVELVAIHQVPIYSTAEKRGSVGHLKKGGKVEVLAMKAKLYQIRGMALHGQVKGWVTPKALDSLDKKFIANLRALYERQKVVDELIGQNQIALGMNLEEVVASLGKPSRKSSKLDKSGRSDVYEYSTYEKVPQYRTARDSYGNLVRQKYYVKVETGKLSINFKNEVVESIEETEGDPLGGKVKIVPMPIELY